MKSLFACVLFLVLTSLKAQQIIVLDSEEKYEFGKLTYVLPDTSGTLSIEEVLSQKQFIPCTVDVYNGKLGVSTYWVKFFVKNTVNSDFYLVIENPLINDLDIYSLISGKLVHLKKGGTSQPFNRRDVLHNNFVFKLDLPKDEVTTIYIRYVGTRREMPLALSTLKKIDERFSLKDLVHGILFGTLLLSIIYNFILFILLKDRSYLFYCSYIFWIGIFRSITLGYLFQYFFPNIPELNDFLYFTSVVLAGTFVILFAMELLQTKTRVPVLHKAGYFVMALYVMSYCFSFYNKFPAANFIVFITFINSVYMVITGIVVYTQGYQPGKFYLIASSSFLISVIIADFRVFEIIPYNFITINIVNFGLVIEAILFSIALGYRYNIFEKEKRVAQEALTKELEFKIEEKAKVQKEQERLNEELRKSNIDLDNFVYTASHELKAPMVNIEGLIELLKDEVKDKEDGKRMLEMMKRSIEKFRFTVNDLIEVSQVQKMRNKDVEEISIEDVVKEVKSDLEYLIDRTKAEIFTDLKGCSIVVFSKKNIYRVVENLVSNAIKFYSPERTPKVFISTTDSSDYCIMEVKDNGLGISVNKQEKVFSMYKRLHGKIEGRGIGLYITKRIIENAGGKIEMESKENEGSTFRVYFKK